jgi:hypothetical protein
MNRMPMLSRFFDFVQPFFNSNSQIAISGGVDLLKMREDGLSNSISSDSETNSSAKARVLARMQFCRRVNKSFFQAQLLLCVRCASYYLAAENVPISCKFHPGSLRIGNDWTATWCR